MLNLPSSQLTIEYHPENGQLPWVVVPSRGQRIWCAFQHPAQACERLSDPKYIALYQQFAQDAQCQS